LIIFSQAQLWAGTEKIIEGRGKAGLRVVAERGRQTLRREGVIITSPPVEKRRVGRKIPSGRGKCGEGKPNLREKAKDLGEKTTNGSMTKGQESHTDAGGKGLFIGRGERIKKC